MKKLYLALLGVTLALLTAIGVWSLFGNGETVSAVDDKTLAEKPAFSLQTLFDGSYLPALESYYSDHFPMRDTLLTAGKTLNKFYYYSGSSEESTVLILGGNTGVGGLADVLVDLAAIEELVDIQAAEQAQQCGENGNHNQQYFFGSAHKASSQDKIQGCCVGNSP